VIADTTLHSVASQRTLIRAGFRLLGTDGELRHYEALLDGDHRPAYMRAERSTRTCGEAFESEMPTM
jgi:hypothetical protein